MISASEARDYGLVNYVVPQEELLSFCEALSDKISKNSSVAISYAIKAVNTGFMNTARGFEAEIKAFGECFGTDDFKEGTTAFLEKRKANFPGA